MERNKFVEALKHFLDVQSELDDPELSEEVEQIESFAPHSDLSDIIYYGERSRSPEEIVDEALARETLWKDGGREAVREHIKANMKQAISDPNLKTNHRYSAMAVLQGIEKEEASSTSD